MLQLVLAATLAADPLHAIIFAGGATEADAQAALASYKGKLELYLPDVVKLPPGEPRIVQSSQLPGLKPGFHIVTFGLCKSPEPVLAAIKAFYPGAYSRPLTGDAGPERCPALAEDVTVAPIDATVNVPAQRDMDLGPQVISAHVVTTASKDDRGRDTSSSMIGFAIVEKATGRINDMITADGTSVDLVGDGPTGREYETCTPSVAAGKKGFVVTRTCVSEKTGCEKGVKAIEKAWTETTQINWLGSGLVHEPTKKTVTSKTPCR